MQSSDIYHIFYLMNWCFSWIWFVKTTKIKSYTLIWFFIFIFRSLLPYEALIQNRPFIHFIAVLRKIWSDIFASIFYCFKRMECWKLTTLAVKQFWANIAYIRNILTNTINILLTYPSKVTYTKLQLCIFCKYCTSYGNS